MILTNEKLYAKTVSQYEFDNGLFTNLKIIVALLATFLRVPSNSKEVSYLPYQNKYPDLKTTFHIKPKIFVGTKLPENLLLPKYLISVAAPLILQFEFNLTIRI